VLNLPIDTKQNQMTGAITFCLRQMLLISKQENKLKIKPCGPGLGDQYGQPSTDPGLSLDKIGIAGL